MSKYKLLTFVLSTCAYRNGVSDSWAALSPCENAKSCQSSFWAAAPCAVVFRVREGSHKEKVFESVQQ